MSFLNALLSIDIALAVALVAAAGLLETQLGDYRERTFVRDDAIYWTAWHVVLALFRSAVICGFALIAYPAVYGARAAPSVWTLLESAARNPAAAGNVVFVTCALLPLLTPFRNRAVLVVPVQGLIGIAMVFGWYTDYLGVTAADWWPGPASGFAIAGMAVMSHLIAVEGGDALGQRIDRTLSRTAFVRIVPNAIELFAQTPVLIYYGLSLGRQIAI